MSRLLVRPPDGRGKANVLFVGQQNHALDQLSVFRRALSFVLRRFFCGMMVRGCHITNRQARGCLTASSQIASVVSDEWR
jgi:hypothetical protein